MSIVLADLYFTRLPNIQKADLQLVGAAAMYIAAKLEEQQPLPVSKFAASTNGRYTPNTILDMETKICKVSLTTNTGPQMAAQPSNDIYVGQPDHAAVGYIPRGK